MRRRRTKNPWIPKPEKPPVPIEDRIAFSQAQAAQLLGVSEPTLRYWRKQGWVRGVKIGKNVLYGREELQRFVREGPQPQTDDKRE